MSRADRCLIGTDSIKHQSETQSSPDRDQNPRELNLGGRAGLGSSPEVGPALPWMT